MAGQLTKRAKEFVQYLNAKEDDLAAILPPGIDPARFVRSAHMAVLGNPDLLDPSVSRRSLYMSIADCARYGLFPDGKEAAIIPYKQDGAVHPRFSPMRYGLVKKILQNEDYVAVRAEPVREGEPFEHREGLNPVLDHVPQTPPDDSAPFDPSVIAAYAIVRHRDLPQSESPFKVVYRKEIEQARNTGYGNTPAWRYWYGEMASKVALRRLSKDLRLSDEAAELVRLDDKLEAGDLVRPDDIKRLRGTGDGRLEPSAAAAEAGRARLGELEEELRGATRSEDGDGDGTTVPAEASETDEGDEGDDQEGDDEGPREPTPEEQEKAETAKRDNFLALVLQYDKQDRVDAAEKLFGGKDDIERTEAGFVDLNALDATQVNRLLEELQDEVGNPPDEEDESDEGDED